MLANYWKQICFVIMIIAILFNVMIKLINKTSLKTEVLESAKYVYMTEKSENNTAER